MGPVLGLKANVSYFRPWLEALPPLPKAVRPDLAAEPNAIGSGYQVRPKIIPQGANIVRSYCTVGLNSQ